MTRWEYDTLENSYTLTNAGLNAMGKEGWELVSLTAIKLPDGWRSDFNYVYVFKRPKTI
jgi:hypothetical protein